MNNWGVGKISVPIREFNPLWDSWKRFLGSKEYTKNYQSDDEKMLVAFAEGYVAASMQVTKTTIVQLKKLQKLSIVWCCWAFAMGIGATMILLRLGMLAPK